MMLRIGIAGQRGGAFLAGLNAVPGVTVAALCDINADTVNRQADEFGVSGRYTKFAEMLDAVDAVIVATPMQLHAAQSVMALHAGKHVLSEVTAAVSLTECWQIADAVESSGKTYMLSENYCYTRDAVLVREMARLGLFGDVYFGEGEYLHDVKPLHHYADGSPTWRYYWQVGQNGSTYPTHSLGPVMQWFRAVHPDERIVTVSCVGSGRHTDPEHPHDDTSILVCQTSGGRLIKIRVDMLSNRPHQMNYYALQGTKGVYEASRIAGQPGHVWLGGDDANRDDNRQWEPLSNYAHLLPESWRNPPDAAKRAGHGGGDYWIIHDWITAIQTGTPPPIDVYQGLEWTAAGLCSQISIANNGVPVRVPDFSDPRQRPITLDAPPVVP